ncbi:MAG: hypothetical protein U0232_22055 [Thermomicrobiales bacterium]
MPDVIALPGGNLGNTSAIGKALEEALALGLIDLPAAGRHDPGHWGRPFAAAFAENFAEGSYRSGRGEDRGDRDHDRRPGLLPAREARHPEDRGDRPRRQRTRRSSPPRRRSTASASAASPPRPRRWRAACAGRPGQIPAGASVLGILTGHLMKDSEAVVNYHQPDPDGVRPGANPPITIDPTLDAVKALLA